MSKYESPVQDIKDERDKMITDVMARVKLFCDKYPWLKINITIGHGKGPEIEKSLFHAFTVEVRDL